MSHKDLVLDRHAFADEHVTRYFTPLADLGVLLNLDEWANFRLITHLTAVEVDDFENFTLLPTLTSGAMQRLPLACTELTFEILPAEALLRGDIPSDLFAPREDLRLPKVMPLRARTLVFFMHGSNWL